MKRDSSEEWFSKEKTNFEGVLVCRQCGNIKNESNGSNLCKKCGCGIFGRTLKIVIR